MFTQHYDVSEDRRLAGDGPLKRFFCENFDHFLTVAGPRRFTEQRVLRAVRSVPDDAARVVRAGLRRRRDTGHHPAGHELQLPAVRGRRASDGRVRRRTRSARLSQLRGLLRPPGPVRPVQDRGHDRGHVLGFRDRPVRHVPRVQGHLLRDAPLAAQHQTFAAPQARLHWPLHQG